MDTMQNRVDDIIRANPCMNAHPDQPAPDATHVWNAFDSIEGYVFHSGPTTRAPYDHWRVETYYLPRPSGRRLALGCVNEPDHRPHPHCHRQLGASQVVEDLEELSQAITTAFWQTRSQKK